MGQSDGKSAARDEGWPAGASMHSPSIGDWICSTVALVCGEQVKN